MSRLYFVGLLLISVCSSSVEAQQSHVIDDVALHTRWVLVPDAVHPTGPGHWLPSGAATSESSRMTQNRPAVLVHTGDPVIVSHESETVRLQLEAKALENATEGGRLHVKLKTGAVIEAIAVAAGRVKLAPHFERQKP